MNIEFPELSKRLLAASGAGLIALAALSACSSEDTGANTDTSNAAEEAGAEEDEAAGGDGTAPESPLPAGSSVEVGDWTVTPASVELDATEAILAENELNTAPAEGNQQAIVTLDGVYNGAEASSMWIDVTFGIWADGTFYDSVDCVNTVGNDLTLTDEVSAGGTVNGSSCVEIPTGAESYVLYFEDLWSFEGTQYFVEIA
jgi:hypothetical protein